MIDYQAPLCEDCPTVAVSAANDRSTVGASGDGRSRTAILRLNSALRGVSSLVPSDGQPSPETQAPVFKTGAYSISEFCIATMPSTPLLTWHSRARLAPGEEQQEVEQPGGQGWFRVLGGKASVLPARGLQARGAWTGLRLYFTPGSLSRLMYNCTGRLYNCARGPFPRRQADAGLRLSHLGTV